MAQTNNTDRAGQQPKEAQPTYPNKNQNQDAGDESRDNLKPSQPTRSGGAGQQSSQESI